MEMWQTLGLVSVVLLVSGLLLLVLRWPLGIHQTFSAHAAQSKKLSVYYFCIFAVTFPLFFIYLREWIVPKSGASNLVTYIFILVTVTQIACTIFPETGSVARILMHRTFAGLSAALLVPLLALLALSANGFAQWLIVLGLVAMLTVFFVGIFIKGKYALLLQSIYYLAFFVPVLISGYLS